MISIDIKSQTKSSPIVLSTSKEEPTLSFSELLKGVKDSKDGKAIQNGALVLALESEQKDTKQVKTPSKQETLLSLLKHDDKHMPKTKKDIPETNKATVENKADVFDTKKELKKETLELHPKITENLSVKEIKTLIADAKEFLKAKILQSDDYKKAQVKELPRTLKGLVTMAKKFGIDVSKITVEEVRATVKNSNSVKVAQTKKPAESVKVAQSEKPVESVKIAQSEKPVESVKVAQTEKPVESVKVAQSEKPVKSVKVAQTEKPVESVKIAQTEKPVESVKIAQTEKPVESVKVAQSEKPVESVKVAQSEKPVENVKVAQTEKPVEAQEKVEKNNTQKIEVNTQSTLETKIKDKTQYVKSTKVDEQNLVEETKTKNDIREDVKMQDKKVEIQKEIKSTPLFKAQEKIEITTEQLVQTKQFKVEEKTPKQRADETLKLLLRGEKPTTQVGTNFTSDFSVATAKVIAPQAKSEVNRSLEQLLHGNVEESGSKIDGLTVHKSDSFEVKINEAKQMIKYLSQDVKTAIEDYKSPFTRVKVQLNPQKLGEIDLTVVQRGKNLHVSLSSNNTAINTLSMNANELKSQLINNGINNASLNFNSQDSSHSQAGQQEQHRQREQQAQDEYNYFENEENSEEILSSLEIVVPNYA